MQKPMAASALITNAGMGTGFQSIRNGINTAPCILAVCLSLLLHDNEQLLVSQRKGLLHSALDSDL